MPAGVLPWIPECDTCRLPLTCYTAGNFKIMKKVQISRKETCTFSFAGLSEHHCSLVFWPSSHGVARCIRVANVLPRSVSLYHPHQRHSHAHHCQTLRRTLTLPCTEWKRVLGWQAAVKCVEIDHQGCPLLDTLLTKHTGYTHVSEKQRKRRVRPQNMAEKLMQSSQVLNIVVLRRSFGTYLL